MQVRVYDVASMSCSYVLAGHTGIVLCLDTCVSSCGRTLIVTGSKDNTVSLCFSVCHKAVVGLFFSLSGAGRNLISWIHIDFKNYIRLRICLLCLPVSACGLCVYRLYMLSFLTLSSVGSVVGIRK